MFNRTSKGFEFRIGFSMAWTTLWLLADAAGLTAVVAMTTAGSVDRFLVFAGCLFLVSMAAIAGRHLLPRLGQEIWHRQFLAATSGRTRRSLMERYETRQLIAFILKILVPASGALFAMGFVAGMISLLTR